MEDEEAAKVLRQREEEIRVGARALTRRITELEKRAQALRAVVGETRSSKMLDEIETLQEDLGACRWQLYHMTAEAIGSDYQAADIALWCDRAEEMGACHPRLDRALLMDLVHVRKVPNAPFRDRLAVCNVTLAHAVLLVYRHLSDIEKVEGESFSAASLMDDKSPQPRILERWLGMALCPAKAPRQPSLRLFVGYEQAVALARALDMDPLTAGI